MKEMIRLRRIKGDFRKELHDQECAKLRDFILLVSDSKVPILFQRVEILGFRLGYLPLRVNPESNLITLTQGRYKNIIPSFFIPLATDNEYQ
jgi:hypothetical protein